MARKQKTSQLKELNITLPTSWGELTPHQVSRVALHLAQKKEDAQFLIQLAIEFADLHPRGSRISQSGDISHYYYHRDTGLITLTAEHFAEMIKVLEWLCSEPEPMAAPELDGLTTPDKRMFAITLEQYITADSACTEFARNQNPVALRTMVAALYPRSKSYVPDLLTLEAQRISYLPTWHFDAVLLWFIGAKKYMMQKYPRVFMPGDAEPDNAPSGVDTLLGLLAAVNDGHLVDNDKLKQTDIHEIFYELNARIANYQKVKK